MCSIIAAGVIFVLFTFCLFVCLFYPCLMQPDLCTSDSFEVTYKDVPLQTATGNITVNSLKSANVK